MGVPFEALLPYAIMLGVRNDILFFSKSKLADNYPKMFGVSGAGLSGIRHLRNEGKPARHSIDQWDRQSTPANALNLLHMANSLTETVMDRDRRLTGSLRGQTDQVEAPPGFELSNPWRVGHTIHEWVFDTSC